MDYSEFALLYLLVVVGGALLLYIIVPAKMAKARNRGAFVWILIAIFFSPI